MSNPQNDPTQNLTDVEKLAAAMRLVEKEKEENNQDVSGGYLAPILVLLLLLGTFYHFYTIKQLGEGQKPDYITQCFLERTVPDYRQQQVNAYAEGIRESMRQTSQAIAESIKEGSQSYNEALAESMKETSKTMNDAMKKSMEDSANIYKR